MLKKAVFSGFQQPPLYTTYINYQSFVLVLPYLGFKYHQLSFNFLTINKFLFL